MQHISNNIVLNESLISRVMTYSSISFSLFFIFMLLLSRPRKVKPYLNRREVMPVSASMSYYQTKKETYLLSYFMAPLTSAISSGDDAMKPLSSSGWAASRRSRQLGPQVLLPIQPPSPARVTQTQGPQEQLLFLLIDWNKEAYKMTRVGYRNPVPIWHRYLCNRYVLEPNQNADFGATFRCHAWAIN